MTLPQAAALLGVTAATLRQQIAKGKLRARKVGRDWHVTPKEVERYRAESRRALPIPIHAIHRGAGGETDGLAHLVPDGQLNDDDEMHSLCGIGAGKGGSWIFSIGSDVSTYLLPLCPKCRKRRTRPRSQRAIRV